MIRALRRVPARDLVAGIVVALMILFSCAVFLTAFVSMLHAQAGPAIAPPSPDLGELVPSITSAIAGLASVAATGFLVKGTTKADSWWQAKVVPVVKPVQPLVALVTSVGLGILGHKLGMTGLQNLNDVLLQAPTATLAAIALREGADKIRKAVPSF